MEADPRTWQGGMEADDRASYGVGGQANWVGPAATAGDLNKQGYYQHQQHQAYGIEAPESRPGYYAEHGPPLGGAEMATSCDPAVYGSGAQVVPIGPASGGVYEALPPPPHHHHHHQHHQHFPSADMEHWHLQMLSQTDPFLALPMRDTPAKRKRRRVISVEQRKAANIRERRRMYQLNEAFDGLRKRVPTFAYEKKLSRIETLKLAVTYIEFMTDLLDNNGEKCKKLLEKAKAKREHNNNNNNQSSEDDATKTLITEDDSLTSVSDNDCASLSRSPNQSAEGKRSRDMSEDELCDS